MLSTRIRVLLALTLMVVFAIAWVWWYYRPTIEYVGL
jgi:hypothetical protein